MSFVELNRWFVPLRKDQEPILSIGVWGHKYAGWLDWKALRDLRRVVLLAEASSGKSEEFRHQKEELLREGKSAFLIRIEELADQGFESALQPSDAQAFERWRDGTDKAWFFLDSVDEARLNRKSFESALKRFARDLGRSVERAHIFISCRATDWKGEEDRALVERLLPAREAPRQQETTADPLLDPIFNKQQESETQRTGMPQAKANELLVVQLVPLAQEQFRLLAESFGVADGPAFVAAINNNRLDVFAERPGDVIDLANYWKSHGRFAALAEMTEYNIDRKLSEHDPFRPDNDTLSLTEARQSAERVAASLTLGKSFTLRAPGYDPDPSLASGALEPAQILQDVAPAVQNALLRRGIFAPSTYGRIRFHHRSTQEYLTASWFHRLLQSNCPREEIWNVLFVERYGVETLVPSMRPVLPG
jgi:hypothetical protein